MLGRILQCIRATSSPQTVAPLICVAWAALGHVRSYRSAPGSVAPYSGSLKDLMARGVPVSVLDFEITAAEAVGRFEDYQRQACLYLHAHSLIKPPASTALPGTRSETGPQQQAPRQAAAPAGAGGGGGARGGAGGAPGGATGTQGGSSAASAAGGSVKSCLEAAYLPFWCFEATYSSEARAQLGFKDASTGEMVWKDMSDPRVISSRAVASYDDPSMQVYASYKHVRDVGAGAAGPGLPPRSRPLTAAEVEGRAVGGVPLHAAAMRQGVAWQLAQRALTHQQLAAAEAEVRTATKATDLKDLHVALKIHSRSCRLVFLPAYVAVYEYGTRYKQGTSGVIVPQVFTAVMGGTREGRVVAPQHLSPAKASLGTGGLVGGLGLLAGELGTWAPSLFGLEALLPSLGGVEALTLAALAASGAGMWAHQRPQKLRAKQAAKQVRADYEFYRKYDIHETYGSGAAAAAAAEGADPQRPGAAAGAAGGGNQEYMLWLWADVDWRRWEEDETWNWDEEERRKWAEELWRKQAVRRLERQRYMERLAAEAARRAAEEEAEVRRERRYGSSARHSHSRHRPRDHGMGGADEGAEGGAAYAEDGFGRRRRRSDFLGYYRALGLQDADAVSTEDIKQAFKTQALLLHPDKHVSADEASQRTTLVMFQKLQIAYDTLKDAEKRRLYDRGQLVQ